MFTPLPTYIIQANRHTTTELAKQAAARCLYGRVTVWFSSIQGCDLDTLRDWSIKRVPQHKGGRVYITKNKQRYEIQATVSYVHEYEGYLTTHFRAVTH